MAAKNRGTKPGAAKITQAKSSGTMSAILENVPVALMLVDGERRVQQVNDTAARLAGRSAGEIVGLLSGEALRCLHSLDDPKGCGFGVSCQTCVIRLNVLDTLQTGRAHPQVEAMLPLSHYQDKLSLLISTAPLRVDGQDMVLVAIQDITERKRAEESLAREKDLLQAIMDNAGAMVAYLDRDFNFVLVNRAYADGSGYPAAALIGKNHFALFPDQQNQAIFERVRDSGIPVEFHDKPFEYVYQPWRSVTYWDWTLTPVKDAPGQVQGLVLCLVETTERKRREQQLEFQANVLAQVNDAVIAADAENRITYWNKAAEKLYDVTAAKAVGNKMDEVLQHLWLKPEDEQAVRESLAGTGAWQGEAITARSDGKEIDVESSVKVLHDQAGNPGGWIAVTRDITKRKLAEKAALQSAKQVQQLFNFDIIGSVVATLDGRIIEANDAFLKMVGYGRDDLISGKINWIEITPPEYEPLDQQALEELFATGSCLPFEKEYIRQDGSRLPVMVGATLWDTAYKTPSWVCFVLDMTRARTAEAALRQSQAHYRTLVESAPDGVFCLDGKGRITDCNEALCRMLGHARENMIGRPILEYVSSMTKEELDAYLIKARQGSQLEAEFEAIARDDRTVPLWAKAVILYNASGDIAQVMVYVRDIEERKKLEQLKDEFIGFVSHELRTPLTIVIGALQTILTENLSPDESNQLLRDAADEAMLLSHILENLLELSRSQAAQLRLRTEPVNIGAVVQSAVSKVKQLYPEADNIVADVPGALPPAKADSLRLERILYNLLENAVKYSPPGSEIKVFARVDDGQMVIGVNDHGPGISRHDQQKLFQPFHRLKQSSPYTTKGAGLGLMVCSRLVEAHGGRIWVESQPGHGSTFYFTLSLV
ncbi:MAG: PAS domain S-box protein [Chloroflexi bacterium]|nr:PAS domain S-box protein [Chloroflexota bacterium]